MSRTLLIMTAILIVIVSCNENALVPEVQPDQAMAEYAEDKQNFFDDKFIVTQNKLFVAPRGIDVGIDVQEVKEALRQKLTRKRAAKIVDRIGYPVWRYAYQPDPNVELIGIPFVGTNGNRTFAILFAFKADGEWSFNLYNAIDMRRIVRYSLKVGPVEALLPAIHAIQLSREMFGTTDKYLEKWVDYILENGIQNATAPKGRCTTVTVCQMACRTVEALNSDVTRTDCPPFLQYRVCHTVNNCSNDGSFPPNYSDPIGGPVGGMPGGGSSGGGGTEGDGPSQAEIEEMINDIEDLGWPLNDCEMQVVLANPQHLAGLFGSVEYAVRAENNVFGTIGGQNNCADAMRHAVLAASLMIFTDEVFANEFLTAHECTTGSLNSTLMDYHNNDVGIEIGRQYNFWNSSLDAIISDVCGKLESGEMEVLPWGDSFYSPIPSDNCECF